MGHAHALGDLAALSGWLRWLEGRGLSSRTVHLYGYAMWRLWEFCRVEHWRDIDEDHVAGFLAAVGDHAPAKVQYSRGLKSFFKWARRRGIIDRDPAAEITPKRPRRRPRVALRPEELERYLRAAAERDQRRMWALMLKYSIAARAAELAAARPEDVLGDGIRLFGKGGKERIVPTNSLARLAIERLRPWTNGTILGGISKQTLTAWGSQAAKDANLYGKLHHRVTHVLRASFITHLLRAGADVGVVRDLVGHENIATTNDYVDEADDETKEMTVGLLERMISPERLAG